MTSSKISSFSKLFEDEGYTVLTADGRSALEQFEAHPDIDMVITDQRMPHMSGVDLLSKVATFAPDTIRVVLTAYLMLRRSCRP